MFWAVDVVNNRGILDINPKYSIVLLKKYPKDKYSTEKKDRRVQDWRSNQQCQLYESATYTIVKLNTIQ